MDNLVLTENGQPIDKLRFEYYFRRAVRSLALRILPRTTFVSVWQPARNK